MTRFRQVTGILSYIATKSNVSKWWGNDSPPGFIALRSIPRITSTISVPPDVIHHSSVTIPIRIHSSQHNAFNTGLIPTNTALTTLAIPSVVVPQHAVLPLNAGSCLCSLGIRAIPNEEKNHDSWSFCREPWFFLSRFTTKISRITTWFFSFSPPKIKSRFETFLSWLDICLIKALRNSHRTNGIRRPV